MKRACCLAAALILSALFAAPLHARLFVTITKDFAQKAPTVLVLTAPDNGFWRAYLRTLADDLAASGYLDIVSASLAGDAAAARAACTDELFIAGVPAGPPARTAVRFTAEDTSDRQPLCDLTVALVDAAAAESGPDPAESAHAASDEIILALTGKPGIARTAVAYVVRSAPDAFRIHRIDVRGQNESVLASFPFMVGYPRSMPGAKALLLVSYKDRWPRLSMLDLATNALSLVMDEPGLSACATVARRTGEIAAVSSRTGDPEIYRVGDRGRLTRLTSRRGVDSSPTFSPDGRQIAFVSDREGGPQVFLMTRDGFNVRRISFVSGNCTAPVWSPDGNLIAYVYLGAGGYGLAVHHVGVGRTVKTMPGLACEELSWAPDSRHVVYAASRGGASRLFVVDIYSGERRALTPEGRDAFSPTWLF